MIKLKRGKCPEVLDDETIKELTYLYMTDKDRDVWNSPKVKQYLKDSLLEMSQGKCAYCECKLNIESKDVTIDHFLPKSLHPSLVISWDNLLPACLRCNREKNRKEDQIINPCEEDPREYIAVKSSSFRLKPVDGSLKGKNTISVLKLNDIERVIQPRMIITEKIIRQLEDVYEDIKDLNTIPQKYCLRCEQYLSQALRDREYSAVAAAKILNDSCFINIKKKLISQSLWNFQLQQIENELTEIALKIG